MDFDENGWATGAIDALDPADAWMLFSPEADARIDAARWTHQAQTFFRLDLTVVEAKLYPSGTLPIADRAHVDVGRRGDEHPSRVMVTTVPLNRAPAAREAAMQGVRAIGGAGFDALIPRGRRLWQVRAATEADDERAALAVTAVLASLFLAPIVPPGGGTIFGVKGARERLAARGWAT